MRPIGFVIYDENLLSKRIPFKSCFMANVRYRIVTFYQQTFDRLAYLSCVVETGGRARMEERAVGCS